MCNSWCHPMLIYLTPLQLGKWCLHSVGWVAGVIITVLWGEIRGWGGVHQSCDSFSSQWQFALCWLSCWCNNYSRNGGKGRLWSMSEVTVMTLTQAAQVCFMVLIHGILQTKNWMKHWIKLNVKWNKAWNWIKWWKSCEVKWLGEKKKTPPELG